MISLESKLYGCRPGKSIGGTLGLPVEGRTERLSPSYYDLVPSIAPPNDDLELQIVEKCGTTLNQEGFAPAWLRHIHYMWDEYGRCRWNLRRGVRLEGIGCFENAFQSPAKCGLSWIPPRCGQKASLLLADAPLHLAPWNGENLPFETKLPSALTSAVDAG